MGKPNGFDWIERPVLAAMARPNGPDELVWLRKQGVQLVITLSETPLHRGWVNDAGLFALHVPIPDMSAPTDEQLHECISAIAKARDGKFGVAIHCTAGLGRTGTVIAAHFVDRGLDAKTAIARVRELRPGSIETMNQEAAVRAFARLLKRDLSDQEPD